MSGYAAITNVFAFLVRPCGRAGPSIQLRDSPLPCGVAAVRDDEQLARTIGIIVNQQNTAGSQLGTSGARRGLS